MATYRVTYTIDVEAENVVAAAQEAHDIITGPDDASLYTFEVQQSGQPPYLITLDAQGNRAEGGNHGAGR